MTLAPPDPFQTLQERLEAQARATQTRFLTRPVARVHEYIDFGDGGGLTEYQREVRPGQWCDRAKVGCSGPRIE